MIVRVYSSTRETTNQFLGAQAGLLVCVIKAVKFYLAILLNEVGFGDNGIYKKRSENHNAL